MSAAIAMAPSPAPHDHRASFAGDVPSAPIPAASVSPSAQRTTTTSGTPNAPAASAPQQHSSRSGSGSPRGQTHGTAKSSPPSAPRNAGGPPKIFVKKEPGGSPELATARHRPRRLDLSKGFSTTSPATARPLTSRESGGLGIQEMGLACLSPGFVTQDPVMKEQVQRSMSVRDQQRHIIEARLQQQSAKGDGMDKDKDPNSAFAAKTPGMSRRNKAPPGLSIVAPSHEQFASERVIQSAPLGQTFTGMNNPHPLTRHIENRPSKLSNTSHIHHVPATQTNNRLPPISDVFGHNLSGHPESSQHAMYAPSQTAHQPLRSPAHSQHPQAPLTATRSREYKSAEEAQHDLAGGRPELLPKLVHYGGHQPPTPPSPLPGAHRVDASRSTSATKRRRDEYEAGISPPLGNGRPSVRRGPFGEGRDSPDTQRAKRDEFLRLCERAWDLFHS
ncbi:hypothetical protein VPNG_00724 [Cytospora leucostoma]|uniref:Uncharacterized protein n=2 Tax=Cytospora TaxID=117544 RepID=A0A423XMS4_9PEZI|nr:hypothetical protein VPNG_00724 [Cytospora leucostoma]